MQSRHAAPNSEECCGTTTPKKATAKTPNKTPKSANKTPLPKPEPEIVENVEKPEEIPPAEDVKVIEVAMKEEKSVEAENLKEQSAKDVAAAEKPAPVNESSPKKGRVSRSFKKIVQCAWLDFHLCITASICVIYWYFFLHFCLW